MDLFHHLRQATGDGHRKLEDELDLLRPPLSKPRFTAVIARFLGFHRVWEPALEHHQAYADLLVGRSRLHHARRDLRALGLSEAAIAAVPCCKAAERLVRTAGAALGSLYVMEGSALGGKVITRALSQAPWVPAQGLRLFDPYGDQAGPMWGTFKQRAREIGPQPPLSEITDGAVETFDILRRWLTPGLPM